MHKIYRDKGLRINFRAIPAGFMYPIDTTDAYELFGNILDNACKAARSEVTVTLQADSRTNSQVHIISISDDGPGIPEAMQSDMLTRGKRLDTYHQGHGIGLATVSDLVEMYGATLEVHSSTSHEKSSGTTISVCLPNK